MLSLNNINMIYGQKLLFADVNLNCNSKHRYAIGGANGCGKSTLLRLITGEEAPSDGRVQFPKGTRLGWLRQDQFIHDDDSVVDVILRGKPLLWQTLNEKKQLLEKAEWTDADGIRLGELEQKIADYDGYTAESFAETLLIGLGIGQQYHHHSINRLSGGMKLRVLLAQSLFENPDILLLDEPTNHLDLMTITWLEHYLQEQFKGLLLFISHDRDFINRVATDVLDIDYGEIRLYANTKYDGFEKEKQLIVEQKIQERGSLERKIAHLQGFVDRFGAKASKARQAQARVKMIDKIALPDLKKSSRIAPTFEFSCQRPSGKQVLTVEGLAKSFSDKTLFSNIKFKVNRGDKLALIGHNGVGKSTLLKIMLAQLEADSGEVEWGHETHVGYFAQDHHELLQQAEQDKNITLLDWLTREVACPDPLIRKTLGRMLFVKDNANKALSTLSGGEAARLIFAKLMLQKNNVLVLDEPTNHLDLESIDALSKALNAYQGTIIFVSHNRYFVSKLAKRVVALTENGVTTHPGNYDDFIGQYGEDYLSRSWLSINQKMI